jgi:hypothetical protein
MPIFGMIFQVAGCDENNAFHSEGRSQGQKNILILLLNYFNGKKNQSCAFWKMTHYIPENNVYTYFR